MIKELLARFARKSQILRRVYYHTLGVPSWSSAHVESYIADGYRRNPHLYGAIEMLKSSASTPPPIIYRVHADNEKVQRAIEAGYHVKGSPFHRQNSDTWREKHVRPARVARALVQKEASRIMLGAGIPEPVARRMATKQMARQGILEEISAHPLLDMLACPNPLFQPSYADFVEAQVMYLMLTGENFVEPKNRSGEPEGEPSELWVLPAQHMEPMPATEKEPLPGWDYLSQVPFLYDTDPALTDIFYQHFPHPDNPTIGMSPIEAAMRSIDISNEARKHNKRLLERGGVPNMAITQKDVQGDLKAEQRVAFEEAWDEERAKSHAAGRPMFLGGSTEVTNLGFDLEKLMWADTLKLSAREISVVTGVPAVLLGDVDAQKFMNMPAAVRHLYFHKTLPLLDKIYGFWNSTWVQRFGSDLLLDYDTDQIEALAEDVSAMYERAEKSTFLTVDEKRAMVGYEDMPGGAGKVILVPANMVPLVVAGSSEEEEGEKAIYTYEGDGAAVPVPTI